MIRALLLFVCRLDRYEWVGIACGVVLLAGLTGVLGPSFDAAEYQQAGAQRQAAR